MAIYRILSLDGGGIRGLITAILLERIEEVIPGVLDQVDLFAGTSTGGLLALGLAAGMRPDAARELYEQKGEYVFKDNLVDNLLDFGNLIGATYSVKRMKEALELQFGDLILDQLQKKVLISSFDLDNYPEYSGELRTWKAKFFHNYTGNDSDGNELVVDVALRTSNAPTYFPIYQGYIDGGVVANNPSMCALAQALNPATGGRQIDEIRLLSIGTGQNTRFLSKDYGDWGVLHWAPHIVDLVMEGSTGLADYQCRQLLSSNYFRINPLLPFPIRMDDIKHIPQMTEIANQYNIENTVEWIKSVYLMSTRSEVDQPIFS